MSKLLPELIEDIFSKLPVKSLCRFKCLSKSWLALIDHPRFVKMHLAHTQRKKLVISYGKLFSSNLEMVAKNDNNIVFTTLDFPTRRSSDGITSLSCIGSYNGLLWIIDINDDFWLYNPSIKEYKLIPSYQSRIIYNPPIVQGFGYAESIDDYKFVKSDHQGKIVEIYSLRENSWKIIENDPHFANISHWQRSSFNGAIHWVFYHLENGRRVIGAFDLEKEEFKTLPSPDIIIKDDCRYTLGNLGGCLCLLTEKSDGKNQFWIMKKYGVKESWTKVLIADTFTMLQPLCYLGTSETMLLYINLQQLVFCDPKNGKFKEIAVHGITYDDIDGEDDWCDVDVYMESLVSLNQKDYFTAKGFDNPFRYWCTPLEVNDNDKSVPKSWFQKKIKQRLTNIICCLTVFCICLVLFPIGGKVFSKGLLVG